MSQRSAGLQSTVVEASSVSLDACLTPASPVAYILPPLGAKVAGLRVKTLGDFTSALFASKVLTVGSTANSLEVMNAPSPEPVVWYLEEKNVSARDRLCVGAHCNPT